MTRDELDWLRAQQKAFVELEKRLVDRRVGQSGFVSSVMSVSTALSIKLMCEEIRERFDKQFVA